MNVRSLEQIALKIFLCALHAFLWYFKTYGKSPPWKISKIRPCVRLWSKWSNGIWTLSITFDLAIVLPCTYDTYECRRLLYSGRCVRKRLWSKWLFQEVFVYKVDDLWVKCKYLPCIHIMPPFILYTLNVFFQTIFKIYASKIIIIGLFVNILRSKVSL